MKALQELTLELVEKLPFKFPIGIKIRCFAGAGLAHALGHPEQITIIYAPMMFAALASIWLYRNFVKRS